MIIFLSKRLLHLIPVFWGVVTIVFLLIHLIPGNPVDALLGENALPASREILQKKLHLNDPISKQYTDYWKNIISGNLGTSLFTEKKVSLLIKERIGNTMLIAFFSFFFSLLIAIPSGILAALHRAKWPDHLLSIFSLFGVSIPSFWLGPLLVLIFSIYFNWLPVSEKTGLSSYILPSITLSLGFTAVLIKLTRSSFIEVLQQDYIKTAESKGLGSIQIYFKHALKNTLIPIISILGIHLGSLLSGAVITETIFDWPGIGELLYRAIQSRDYPVVQGCVLMISIIYVLTNTIADICYTLANQKLGLNQSNE